MLLGRKLHGAYSGWRVVEGDLYGIAGRVREYDTDARLIREDETGHLGLGVIQRNHHEVPGGVLVLARHMYDPVTDEPLNTEPDARALRCQRSYDSRRFSDIRTWNTIAREASKRREFAKEHENDDSFGDNAERYVHAHGKDVVAKPRAFFKDRDPVAA